MTEFVKGMNVKTTKTKYGEIIKIGIKKDDFLQNPFSDSGWLNVDILTSKEGKKYAKINDYKPDIYSENIDEEEIPF